MTKMTLLDMSWFLLESKTIPVHGGFLHVFTPPAGAPADYSQRLLAEMKQRAVGAPFNLRPRLKLGGMPYWEEVEVDLAQHVFEVHLPSPGNDQQLLAAAAEAIAEPLSWSLPLWRCHWIHGLNSGRFAFMLVAHHSQWDGMAMFRLMGETMSESALSKTIRAPWQGVSTWQQQVGTRKEKKTQPSAPRQLLGTVRAAARIASDMSQVFAQHGLQAIKDSRRAVLPLAAPESRPQRNGSGERVYGLAKFQLSRVKALAKASEYSFNDVMTTVVDAAYATYLDELGIPAHKPLVALVPIALKVAGAGNQLSGGVVALGNPGSSLLARLADINRSMSAAKSNVAAMSSASAKLYAMIVMGVAAAPDLLRVGERLPVTANLMISNPFGVPKPLFLNGARLDYFLPMLGPSLGTRMMAGIWTYADETFISFTSLRSVVPDIDRLATLAQQSFDELESAVLGDRKPGTAVAGVNASAGKRNRPQTQ